MAIQQTSRMASASTAITARSKSDIPNQEGIEAHTGPRVESAGPRMGLKSSPKTIEVAIGAVPKVNIVQPPSSNPPETRRRVLASARRASASLCLVSLWVVSG